jgi:hypothetical protein
LIAWIYSNLRTVLWAVITLLIAPLAGCVLFHKDTWNLDRLRDERAVDIERRLERKEPIVKDPF